MLVGMTELLNVENIPDQQGLYTAWELTFGGVSHLLSSPLRDELTSQDSPGTNIMLCADYWQVDYPLDSRRAVLDQSRFPFQPSGLLNVLRALAVPDINDIVAESLFGLDPTHHACDYFNSFSNATFVTPSSAYTLSGIDQTGRKLVRSTQVITLPGGVDLPRGTTGIRLTADDLPPVITWNITMPGWKLLIETMRAATGLPATPLPPSDGTAIQLSVADLYSGTEPPSSTGVLSSGFRYLTAVLRPSSSLTLELLRVCAPDSYTVHPLVEISLSVLANFDPSYDPSLAVDALRLLSNLVVAPETNAWQALKSSPFFGGYGRKRSPATMLLHASQKGDHSIALALLRLVISLVETAPRVSEDDVVLRSAIHIVFTDIWSVFPGWRYGQVATKFEIASLLLEVFDTVLRNPMSRHGDNVTPTAQAVIGLFVTDASPLTYRPIIDVITQAAMTLRSMVARHREQDARWIIESVNRALVMLSNLFRLASSLQTHSSALPFGIMAATVVSPSSQKIQLFDYLLELTDLPSTQPLTTLLCLKTARSYLEAIAPDSKRPSIAGLLRDPVRSFAQLARLAEESEAADTRAAAWQLLSTIVVTQRGCATAVVSSEQAESLEGALRIAVTYITEHSATYLDQPHVMAAVLLFLQAILDCPSLDQPISLLRKQAPLWEAIHDIALRLIPSPPTFQLSMHADDFAARIWLYAYSVQAKANATSVLATELGLSVDIDGPETKAQTLVLSLFRNASNLTDAAALASHTSCDPRLHEEQLSRLQSCGWGLNGLRTIALSAEREYGSHYLYGELTPSYLESVLKPQMSPRPFRSMPKSSPLLIWLSTCSTLIGRCWTPISPSPSPFTLLSSAYLTGRKGTDYQQRHV
jgi:nuclear pore complex protein Nup188